MLRGTSISRMKKKRKGQSTVEYLVVVTAVLAVLLVFLGPNGPFRQAYNSALQVGSSSMTNMANRLANSYPVPG